MTRHSGNNVAVLLLIFRHLVLYYDKNDIGETPDMKGSEFFAEGSIVNKISLAGF